MPIDLEKLEDSDHLVNLLVAMEDTLDRLDVYVYPNWLDGEVIEGPIVRPHFVSWSLLYPADKEPDARAARRLMLYDINVEISRITVAPDLLHGLPAQPADLTGADPGTENGALSPMGGGALIPPAPPAQPWLVKIAIPRRLLQQFDEVDAALYDDGVDKTDVEDAKDSGLSDQSEFVDPALADDTQAAGQPDPDAAAAVPPGTPQGAPPVGGPRNARPA